MMTLGTTPRFRTVEAAVRYMLSCGVTFERLSVDDLVYFADPARITPNMRKVMADWKAPILRVLGEAGVPDDGNTEGATVNPTAQAGTRAGATIRGSAWPGRVQIPVLASTGPTAATPVVAA